MLIKRVDVQIMVPGNNRSSVVQMPEYFTATALFNKVN